MEIKGFSYKGYCTGVIKKNVVVEFKDYHWSCGHKSLLNLSTWKEVTLEVIRKHIRKSRVIRRRIEMLKINPEKDIKELEKFGFEYDEDIKQYFYYAYTEPNDMSEVRYYVDVNTGKLSIGFDEYVSPYNILDKAYDLIKADMVVKE